MRPAKNIDSGPGSPGDFPISESRGPVHNRHVFSTEQSAELATKNKSELVTSTRPALSLRGATHRTKHDASLRKHYRNVDGQPTARGAARNRLPSCTEHTTSNPGNEAKNYSPHLCGNVRQKDANDGAGARLGMCLEGSNAEFMPPKHHLDLLDETVRV